jgi:hypothetical protein
MNCQPKVKIPCHFVTTANQNRDKLSPLLLVYLMKRVETIWTSVIIWGHLTFVGAFIKKVFIVFKQKLRRWVGNCHRWGDKQSKPLTVVGGSADYRFWRWKEKSSDAYIVF